MSALCVFVPTLLGFPLDLRWLCSRLAVLFGAGGPFVQDSVRWEGAHSLLRMSLWATQRPVRHASWGRARGHLPAFPSSHHVPITPPLAAGWDPLAAILGPDDVDVISNESPGRSLREKQLEADNKRLEQQLDRFQKKAREAEVLWTENRKLRAELEKFQSKTKLLPFQDRLKAARGNAKAGPGVRAQSRRRR